MGVDAAGNDVAALGLDLLGIFGARAGGEEAHDLPVLDEDVGRVGIGGRDDGSVRYELPGTGHFITSQRGEILANRGGGWLRLSKNRRTRHG